VIFVDKKSFLDDSKFNRFIDDESLIKSTRVISNNFTLPSTNHLNTSALKKTVKEASQSADENEREGEKTVKKFLLFSPHHPWLRVR
jgi:hypothetical protein